MATGGGRQHWMAYEATLGGMADAGTRVRERCPRCNTWIDVNVSLLLCEHGPDFSLVDHHPECDRCGGPVNFHASAGPSTPFRPLVTS